MPGAEKQNLHFFFFSIAFHTYLVFLSFFFFQVFVTLCVSDLKLDRSVACPLFDMSNFCYCCLQYMGANVASISWTYATNFNLEVSSWVSAFFFFSIFFLSFSNLAMPKGLRANLNVADIGSVVPYPEHLQGNFSKKDNLSLWCDSLSICSPRELKRWERFVCLLEVGWQKSKILPSVLRMHIWSQLCKPGKLVKFSKAGGRSGAAFTPLNAPDLACLSLCPLTCRAMQWEMSSEGLTLLLISECLTGAEPGEPGLGHGQERWFEVFTAPSLTVNDEWLLRMHTLWLLLLI